MKGILLFFFFSCISFIKAQTLFEFEVLDEIAGISSVDVAELNDAGKLDIAVTQWGGERVLVYTQDEFYSFTLHEVETNIENASNLHIVDFDDDNLPDLVFTGRNTSLFYYDNRSNDGELDFGIGRIDGFGTVSDVASGDIDDDGFMDLVIGDTSNKDLLGFRQVSRVLFDIIDIDPTANRPGGIEIADMDSDGDGDIIYNEFSDDYVAIYYHENDFNFNKVIIDSNADNPNDLEVSDLDLDGDLDILASLFSDDMIVIYWNENGIFSKSIIDSNMKNANELASGDLDFDGDIDLVANNTFEDRVYLFYNENGEYNKILLSDKESNGELEMVDIDNDFDLDIITNTPTELVIFRNTHFEIDDDNDGFLIHEDCDDLDPNINPAAVEIPGNGIDENCDGLDVTVAVHDLLNAQLKIFPNPASNFLKINTDDYLNYRASLFDINGKKLFSQLGVSKIELTTYPNGSYILHIQDLESNAKFIEQIEIIR